MAEYIDRGTAIVKLTALEVSEPNATMVGAKRLLAEIPAADVAPVVHGRWMHEETEGGFHIWRCSRCGRGMNDNPEGIDSYCYHCGAKMDGGNS